MNTEITNVIVVKQLPVIIEQLKTIKAEIETATADALALECTDDTVNIVKKSRANLNKSLADYETRRKEVKNQILAPYEAFEKIYKDCITIPFGKADVELKRKIDAVEFGLKENKSSELKRYYLEYMTSVGLSEDEAPFVKAPLNVTLSATMKSLKEQAKAHIDRIQQDIAMIATLENHDEILVEYKKFGNAAAAITTVSDRKKAIEEERRRAEERDNAEEDYAEAVYKVEEIIEAYEAPEIFDEPIIEPVIESGEELPIYEATFTVRATMSQLAALKQFLINGGYDFE